MKTKQTIEIEFYDFDDELIKKAARGFAYDLVRYAKNGGDMENPTAAKVYELLGKLDKGDKNGE